MTVRELKEQDDERKEETPKIDLSTRDGAKECEEYVNRLLMIALKAHPKYPEYGYVYENGKLIEKKLML